MNKTVTYDDKAFRRALHAKAQSMAGNSAKLVGLVGEQVAQAARNHAPGRRLRSSIKSRRGTDARGPYAEVSADPWWASFVEYGTSTSGPRPFMRPASEQGRSAVIRGASIIK